MRYHFTPAAERALRVAAGWTSCDDHTRLYLPEVLVGLLDEPEYRAAQFLAQHGVDLLAVCDKWNTLTPVDRFDPDRSERFSGPLELALQAAERLLWDYPQPLSLATEHVLLGLVANESDVATWLREHGLSAELLEAEIHRAAGHERGPLTLPGDQPLVAGTIGEVLRSPGIAIPGLRPEVPTDITRIVDAAANRAAEGLRVVEDYVRFLLDDRHLTAQLKSLRHELTAALNSIPPGDRLVARQSEADVGADTKTPSELTRSNLASVITANFQRLQQALRSLEEFTKLSDPVTARSIERLRYRAYTLERAVEITRSSFDRLRDAQLYVLVDACAGELEFRRLVEALVAAGTHILQLREKSLDDRTLLSRARLLRELTRGTSTLFIMNDRTDLAVLADADGVHVGQDELAVKDARTIVGPQRLVGVSTHSLEQARQAVIDGANYIGVGPTFPSGTKQFADFPGLALVRVVTAEIRLPTFAIGGITLDNLADLFAAGGRRVALSAAVVAAADPESRAGEFVRALSAYPPQAACGN